MIAWDTTRHTAWHKAYSGESKHVAEISIPDSEIISDFSTSIEMTKA